MFHIVICINECINYHKLAYFGVLFKIVFSRTITYRQRAIIMPPTVGKVAITLLLSVCPSVRLSVCPSVAYIANNSRTQRASIPKFGMKVPHFRCDSHTSFKVKRSNIKVTDGRRGHTMSVKPGDYTLLVTLNYARYTHNINYMT